MYLTNHLLLLPIVLLCLLAASPRPALAKKPRVGERVAALRLPTIDGTQTVDLRDLRGKRVLLIEFASW